MKIFVAVLGFILLDKPLVAFPLHKLNLDKTLIMKVL